MEALSSISTPASGEERTVRTSRMSDELLARSAAGGSDRAFEAIYKRYSRPLYGYVRSIVRDDHDAQDVLQSTFTSALAALRRGQRRAPLRPWLYRIAHNEAISAIRSRRRASARGLDDPPDPVVRSAEEEALENARWTLLMSDLSELPERLRNALLLRELSGLSHAEIALAMGTTHGAAKQAILEARQGLLDIQEGRSMGCEEIQRLVSDGDRRTLRGRRVRAHLRACAACRDFSAALEERRNLFRVCAPVLTPAVAASVLERVNGAGLGSGAAAHGGTVGAAAARAGMFGKAAGVTASWKAASGIALVLAAATVGGAAVKASLASPARSDRPAVRQHATTVAHHVRRTVRTATPPARVHRDIRQRPHQLRRPRTHSSRLEHKPVRLGSKTAGKVKVSTASGVTLNGVTSPTPAAGHNAIQPNAAPRAGHANGAVAHHVKQPSKRRGRSIRASSHARARHHDAKPAKHAHGNGSSTKTTGKPQTPTPGGNTHAGSGHANGQNSPTTTTTQTPPGSPQQSNGGPPNSTGKKSSSGSS